MHNSEILGIIYLHHLIIQMESFVSFQGKHYGYMKTGLSKETVMKSITRSYDQSRRKSFVCMTLTYICGPAFSIRVPLTWKFLPQRSIFGCARFTTNIKPLVIKNKACLLLNQQVLNS